MDSKALLQCQTVTRLLSVCDTGWINPADAHLAFDLDSLDFGTLQQGEVVSLQYSFYNLGPDTLQIRIVSACDCLDVNWTTVPIPPGERGYIDVVYDSTGRAEPVHKDIDVVFENTDAQGYPFVKRVVLKGNVKRE